MRKHVLIVRNGRNLPPVLRQLVEQEAYDVECTAGYGQARRAIASLRPALVLLDLETWEKPAEDFLFALTLLRNPHNIRKIILADHAGVEDKISALELGADDFLFKPISLRELSVRLAAVLRTHEPENIPSVFESVGPLQIRRQGMEVFVNGEEKKLSRTEFNLLAFLFEHPGEVFSRDVLLENLWLPAEEVGYPRIIDVYICRLRDKIEADPSQPSIIVTRRGHGYSLIGPQEA